MLDLFKEKNKQHYKEVAKSFIRIGRLLEQGYPLEVALNFILLHTKKTTREQFELVIRHLQEGHSVHESFRSLDIPTSIKSFFYFYEHQGDLEKGFSHAGFLLLQRENTIAELMKLLRYPIALLFFCGLVLLLMFQFVLPHFRSYFLLMNTPPPLLTKWFLSFLYHLPYLLIIACILFVLFFVYFYLKVNKLTPSERTNALVAIPYVQHYVKTVITYFFALQLGRLMRAGMSLQQSLKQFQTQDYLPFLQQECVQISYELQEGLTFQEIVKTKNYLRAEISFVIDNGERTGYLGSDLEQYSDILYLELEDSIQKILHLIQPILFIIVGGFVFILFLVTMLPLFQMVGGI
ncbi:competence type IV pilus assembly protein ComGB [Alkalihalobacillus sp. MEB130]|uniref:competence type IV pilus assembly protein ComGB n=1 Tax=Alkalihalobacillus sp. MEB130 TaxID=2976704 RepID=UPI0028DE8F82|nr:competence type IV pilus assembly protein ComGB [Alkalihalobacillus sp. MEB130]MDT8862764.1 competence type IV pilus assembly protein ComGB [Alkalihalobacillus sp. MEB130]